MQANTVLTKQTDIAAQISSRICHDLISPIGAISNGLELLALSGAPLSPELTLISESVAAANAKLRFLRIAFGGAKRGSKVGVPEITDILRGYYNDPRTQLNCTLEAALGRRDLRLLFLILLTTEKLAPYGGQITVVQKAADFTITVVAKNLKTDGFLDLSAHRFIPQDGPPLIQFTLAQNQLDQMGYTMRLSETSDKLAITITP
jgi:histidine phosphotransferase ChpT